MMRGYEDWFVGAVTIGLGVFLVTVAAANWQWYYSLTTARLLKRWFGARGARWFHALLGILLVTLGVAVARGFQLFVSN